MNDSRNTGFLKIRAVSADGAFPVEGATVTVSRGDGQIVASLRTDISGLTDTLALPAPSSALSQSPESTAIPYAVYDIRIFKEGYYPIEDISVPVFDKITAIQQANMIPLSEFAPISPAPLPQRFEDPGYPALRKKEENANE